MADPDSSPTQSTIEAHVPAAIAEVYRRLQRWRSERKRRALIPEALWGAAGELAREHGGAAAGDLFMSLIHTCQLSDANSSSTYRVTGARAGTGGQSCGVDAVELPSRCRMLHRWRKIMCPPDREGSTPAKVG